MEHKLEAFAMTGLTVLLTIVAYRLFLKPFVPANIQGWIGL